MADPINLLYRPRPTQIANLLLDGTLSETHGRTAEATDNEVEEGADVTDHVRLKPATLVLEGIMTNTPLDDSAVAAYQSSGPFGLVTDDDEPSTPGRAENAFALLEVLFEAKQPITVVTNLKTYKSMIIESMQVPRDAKSGDAVRVSLSFKQIRLVSNKLVTVSTNTPGAKKKQNLGDKQGTEKPVEEYQSAFSRLTGIGEVGEGLN